MQHLSKKLRIPLNLMSYLPNFNDIKLDGFPIDTLFDQYNVNNITYHTNKQINSIFYGQIGSSDFIFKIVCVYDVNINYRITKLSYFYHDINFLDLIIGYNASGRPITTRWVSNSCPTL